MPRQSHSKKHSRENLGKGIRSLLKNIDSSPSMIGEKVNSQAFDIAIDFAMISPNHIIPNPSQPRKDFGEKNMMELVASIKTHSIIQPITVKKISNNKYMIISGERRWRAAQMAELKTIPAYLRTANDQEVLEMALLENISRQDLNAIEIALSLARLLEECELKQEQLADRIGKDRSTITNYLRLLKLPYDIQQSVRQGSLSMGHARAIITLDQADIQLFIFNQIIEKNLSVRQTEKLVKEQNQKKGKGKQKGRGTERISKIKTHIDHIQKTLASQYGANISINHNEKTSKGKISIEYHSIDEMNKIIEKMRIGDADS